MKKIIFFLLCLISLSASAGEIVRPTWTQAFRYALKSNYTIWVISGFILLAIAFFIAIKKDDGDPITEEGFFVKYKVIFIGILITFSAMLFYSKPGSIRNDNEKNFEPSSLQYYRDQDKELNTFWDSLYRENRLIGAPVK